VSLISRFVGSPLSGIEQGILAVCILLLAGLVLRHLAKQPTEPARNIAVSLICLATSLVGFHRGYDLVLLTAPLMLALVPSRLPVARHWIRPLILVLFAVLALNWMATESVLAAWQLSRPGWLAVTSLNGFCVLVLFLSYLSLGIREGLRPQQRPSAERAPTAAAELRVVGSPDY